MDTIDEILARLRAWEPAVRVLGNVMARDAIEAIERLRAEISTAEAFHKVAVAERDYERQRADILESATIKALEDRDRLRAELAVTRAELVVSVGHLSRLAHGYGCEDFSAAVDAALAAEGEK